MISILQLSSLLMLCSLTSAHPTKLSDGVYYSDLVEELTSQVAAGTHRLGQVYFTFNHGIAGQQMDGIAVGDPGFYKGDFIVEYFFYFVNLSFEWGLTVSFFLVLVAKGIANATNAQLDPSLDHYGL